MGGAAAFVLLILLLFALYLVMRPRLVRVEHDPVYVDRTVYVNRRRPWHRRSLGGMLTVKN